MNITFLMACFPLLFQADYIEYGRARQLATVLNLVTALIVTRESGADIIPWGKYYNWSSPSTPVKPLAHPIDNPAAHPHAFV